MGYRLYRLNHRNDALSIEAIDGIILKQWSPESVDTNDYLFVPRDFDIVAVKKRIAAT